MGDDSLPHSRLEGQVDNWCSGFEMPYEWLNERLSSGSYYCSLYRRRQDIFIWWNVGSVASPSSLLVCHTIFCRETSFRGYLIFCVLLSLKDLPPHLLHWLHAIPFASCFTVGAIDIYKSTVITNKSMDIPWSNQISWPIYKLFLGQKLPSHCLEKSHTCAFLWYVSWLALFLDPHTREK